MKVFISWSGKRARFVAEALREWLPDIVQVIEPWVSSEDIEAGKRWGPEIDAQLENTKFGIICVTSSNQNAAWLNFEAGALAKSVEASNVVPLLIDISPADLEPGPLTRFQALEITKAGLFTLVSTINKKSSIEPPSLKEGRLNRLFETLWPILEKKLKNLPIEEQRGESRSQEAMIEELLQLTRELSRKVATGNSSLSFDATSLRNIIMSNAEPILKSFLSPAKISVSDNKDEVLLLYNERDKFHKNNLLKQTEKLRILVDTLFGSDTMIKVSYGSEDLYIKENGVYDDLPF